MGDNNHRLNKQMIGTLLEIPGVTQIRYKKDDLILRQDDDAYGIYYLLKGRVRVVLLSQKGLERVLCMHDAGQFIGEASSLGRTSFIASTYADEDVTLLKMDNAACRYIISHYPDITMQIINGMGEKIAMMVEQIEQATFFEARVALARVLLMLMYKFGEETPEGICIRREMSDRDLGTFIGNGREVTNRLMTRMRQEGILQREKSRIYILDKDKLEQIAGNV